MRIGAAPASATTCRSWSTSSFERTPCGAPLCTVLPDVPRSAQQHWPTGKGCKVFLAATRPAAQGAVLPPPSRHGGIVLRRFTPIEHAIVADHADTAPPDTGVQGCRTLEGLRRGLIAPRHQ